MIKFLEYAGMGLWAGFTAVHMIGTGYLAIKTHKNSWVIFRLAVAALSAAGWVLVAPSVFT